MNGEVVPRGFCQCGCGQPTARATRNFHARGIRKGEPMRYLRGHQPHQGPKPIPPYGGDGLCQCGCGEATPIATKTEHIYGHVRGHPRPFVPGHHPRTHGRTKTPEYRCWVGMIARCTNVNHHAYANYGGRGIEVCERWRASFEAFLADMGERPPGRSIDRIDNDGNYEPDNCRWATPKEQAANRRRRAR